MALEKVIFCKSTNRNFSADHEGPAEPQPAMQENYASAAAGHSPEDLMCSRSFDFLRSDARFKAFERRLGLPIESEASNLQR